MKLQLITMTCVRCEGVLHHNVLAMLHHNALAMFYTIFLHIIFAMFLQCYSLFSVAIHIIVTAVYYQLVTLALSLNILE